MDWTQISISIIIPLAVSLFAWTLTYIIPYIFPKSVSKALIRITRTNSKNFVEIGLIINQFTKYDDWKRLTAYERMKKLFIRKIREIEEINNEKWFELNSNVIKIPLKTILDKLDLLLMVLKDNEYEKKHEVNITSEDVKNYFKDKIKILEENQEKYSNILKKHPDAIIWDIIESENTENYNKKNYFLTLKEIEMIEYLKHTTLDEDGSMTKEDFLKQKNHEKPEIQSQNEILTTFNNVIIYIDYPHLKKEELSYRLALGLSDHEKSCETLIKLIAETKIQILQKDLKKLEKMMNLK